MHRPLRKGSYGTFTLDLGVGALPKRAIYCYAVSLQPVDGALLSVPAESDVALPRNG
jgi:hypothetical protein